MKHFFTLFIAGILISSCNLTRPVARTSAPEIPEGDPLIAHALFSDKSATIPEENIQKILNGNFKLPAQLRVAIVKMESEPRSKRSRTRTDEDYQKLQQSYLEVLSEKLRLSSRVTRISVIPDLLVCRSSSFTNIREAAVRMQADLVVIYSISSDVYSRYKAPTQPDIKAFATTQLVMMDVKSGMVPFSTVVTKDYLNKKKPDAPEDPEAIARTEHEAVLTTIFEVGQQMTDFLKVKS